VWGGRPGRVKVIGHASLGYPGAAMPSVLRGASRPVWLDARSDSLQVAIYKRLKTMAVPMKEAEPTTVEEVKTDPSKFAAVPKAAAQTLAAIKDALGTRDYAALRPQLDDNVIWSLGGGTGADVALGPWQADPTAFDALDAAIEAGCAEQDKKVTCPAGPPKRNVYQLILEPRGTTYKVTSFVKAE
jgi:hypothetical protein